MTVTIKRVKNSEYELVVDGSIVKTYQQTKMKHPWDWYEDAIDAGVAESELRARNFEYIDDR
jgi:hypothetical protein